jgi:hypothetical protein
MKLIGGNISDSPVKNVHDGSAFFVGGGGLPDHSKTVVMYTMNYFMPEDDAGSDKTLFSGLDIGPKFHLNNSAIINATNAHTEKGFSAALQLNVASDGGNTLEFSTNWGGNTTNFLYEAGVNRELGGAYRFDMTLEFYFRTIHTWGTASNNTYSIMGMFPSREYWGITKYGPNDSICLYHPAGGWATGDYGIGSPEISPNTWYHLRIAYDQSAGRGEYFLDGVHTGGEAVTTSMGGPSDYANGIFKIGDEDAFGSNAHFGGQICGFAIRTGHNFVSTDTFTPPTYSQMIQGNWD